ncbi:response regulator [Marichromatium gracile]|uniref:Response regulator receiver protein n=1 Tax=Marichromatium gracile TaxID=1048 RepID=A0ABR5VEZ1_MARGR|nr:response regulator [Marichromatium gracile]KXX64102.1 response regulator receiver protein [Marichromatium gracile]
MTELLVVDDEPLNLEIIADFLQAPERIFTFAQDGQDAWDRLQAEPTRFDLLILDRRMPRMDGIELLERVVRDPRFEDLPVIMQTVASSPEEVAQGLSAGAWYYLAKPYQAEALQRIVNAALLDRRNRHALRQLQREISSTWGLLQEGRFRFREPRHASLLAVQLADLCPRASLVAMGLSELMINAIEHGLLGIGYEEKGRLLAQDALGDEIERRLARPEQASRWAELWLRREAERICFTVCDHGPGFDWAPYLELAPERAFHHHGRGIAMARQLAFSALDYQGRGNVVQAWVSLNESTSESNDE